MGRVVPVEEVGSVKWRSVTEPVCTKTGRLRQVVPHRIDPVDAAGVAGGERDRPGRGDERAGERGERERRVGRGRGHDRGVTDPPSAPYVGVHGIPVPCQPYALDAHARRRPGSRRTISGIVLEEADGADELAVQRSRAMARIASTRRAGAPVQAGSRRRRATTDRVGRAGRGSRRARRCRGGSRRGRGSRRSSSAPGRGRRRSGSSGPVSSNTEAGPSRTISRAFGELSVQARSGGRSRAALLDPVERGDDVVVVAGVDRPRARPRRSSARTKPALGSLDADELDVVREVGPVQRVLAGGRRRDPRALRAPRPQEDGVEAGVGQDRGRIGVALVEVAGAARSSRRPTATSGEHGEADRDRGADAAPPACRGANCERGAGERERDHRAERRPRRRAWPPSHRSGSAATAIAAAASADGAGELPAREPKRRAPPAGARARAPAPARGSAGSARSRSARPRGPRR